MNTGEHLEHAPQFTAQCQQRATGEINKREKDKGGELSNLDPHMTKWHCSCYYAPG